MRLAPLTDTALVEEFWRREVTEEAYLARWSSLQLRQAVERGETLGLWQREELAAMIVRRVIGPEHVEIDQILVAGRFRRLGCATRLLEAVKGQFPQAQIYLEVHEKNLAARAFYQRQGFVDFGRRPGYYVDQAAAHCLGYSPMAASSAAVTDKRSGCFRS